METDCPMNKIKIITKYVGKNIKWVHYVCEKNQNNKKNMWDKHKMAP